MSVGGNGRFLIVAGKGAEVDAVQQVVTSLDIDELRGRSFVLIPLKQASAEAVTRDLSQMIATAGAPQAKIIPLERMNAIMVVSRDPALAARIRRWVPRLDANGPDQRRVYVYPVRNRRASEIASVLEGMFAAKGKGETAGTTSTVAPGLSSEQVDLHRAAARHRASARPPRRRAHPPSAPCPKRWRSRPRRLRLRTASPSGRTSRPTPWW